MTANRIIAHVFLQPSLHLVNEAVMERLVADHPYFSAARLLLARKVYQETGDLQSDAVKRALLYTNQHHYAYQVISEEQLLQEVENRVAAVIPEDTLPGETVNAITAPSVTMESIADEIVLPVVEDRIPEVIPEDALPTFAATEPIVDEEVATMAAAAVQPIAENHFAVISEDVKEVEAPPAAEVVAELSEVAMPAPVAEVATEFSEVAMPAPDAGLSGTTIPVPAVEAAIDLQDAAAVSTVETTEAPIAIADFEHTGVAATITPEMPPPPVIAPAAENPHNSIEEQGGLGPIRIFPLSERVEETELIFQPLYTDDYFAYKRLKNPEEADDLNEQGAAEMKSFTSWLRQMKDNFVGKTSKDWYHQQLHRIYEEEEEPEVSETVEKMAMDSIVFNNDIVSETLAEIWVRQHQYSNAIKIYQKLSLLNPDKNAYFAQKILELKSQTDKK
jgi:hypothetical protein